MKFTQVWFVGLYDPQRSFEELKNKPAPFWGLQAVLIRFVVTSLTTTLALHLLGRVPFTPSRLTFLTMENYYFAEIFFLPVFGFSVWLLGSSIVHIVLRLAGRSVELDQVLNVIGMGMLIPMPAVLLWDWSMIALDLYRLPVMAISHSVFALWGVMLYSIGFRRVLGLPALLAGVLALAVTGAYISLAVIFVR